MKTFIKCLVIFVQLVALLLAPRFGWSIRHSDTDTLGFSSSYRENGCTYAVYGDQEKNVTLIYPARFSRMIHISIDGNATMQIQVRIDGGMEDTTPPLPGTHPTIADVVWKDSSGLFLRVYFISAIFVVISLVILGRFYRSKGRPRFAYALLFLLFFSIALFNALRLDTLWHI